MKKIEAATDFTDYTDFMEISVPVRQQSVKSVAVFENRLFSEQLLMGLGRTR
jgi:hypothetical protein